MARKPINLGTIATWQFAIGGLQLAILLLTDH